MSIARERQAKVGLQGFHTDSRPKPMTMLARSCPAKCPYAGIKAFGVVARYFTGKEPLIMGYTGCSRDEHPASVARISSEEISLGTASNLTAPPLALANRASCIGDGAILAYHMPSDHRLMGLACIGRIRSTVLDIRYA